MKKSLTVLTVFSLLAVNFSFINKVFADTATNASTTINVEVTDDNKPIDPSVPPTDPDDPSSPGVVDPDGDDQSIPNDNIGDAKLAIWRIPSNMNFKGKYDPVLDVELDLEVAEGNQNRRVLSIADVRKGETEWKLTSQLVNFRESTEQVTNQELNENSSLTMKASAKKHKVEGKQVFAKEFIEDTNGVVMGSNIKVTSDERIVAEAIEGNGKGYTGLIFEDIKLHILGGNINSTNYIGQINWTLSDTVN